MNPKITEMAAWKAAHRAPVADACRWSAAIEEITLANMKILFAWQRMFFRFGL